MSQLEVTDRLLSQLEVTLDLPLQLLHIALGLLLLLQLGNQFLLVSNLLPQGVDLVVLGALVLLALFAVGLKSLDGVPETVGVSGNLSSGLVDAINELFLSLDALVGVVDLFLNVALGSLQPLSLVNDVLHCGSSGGKDSLKFILLGNKGLVL